MAPPDGVRLSSPSKYPGRTNSGHDAACVREHPHQSQSPRQRTGEGARPIRPVPTVALGRDIDEISTLGLEVLSTLEKKVTQATRTKGTWKCNGRGEARPFGGLNLILTGDLWRFPPVKATAIFQKPFAGGTSCQVAGLQKLLWSRTESGIHTLFELTTEPVSYTHLTLPTKLEV